VWQENQGTEEAPIRVKKLQINRGLLKYPIEQIAGIKPPW
jgi:hypothetical protein